MFDTLVRSSRANGLFSLYYGDEFVRSPAADTVTTDGDKIRKTFTLGNLRIEEETTVLPAFHTVENRIRIRNVGECDTKRIRALKTVDTVLPVAADTLSGFPCDRDYAKVVWYRGWAREPEECCPHDVYLTDKSIHSFSPIQARSCDGTMAYFDVVRQSAGAVICVGWTGQWQADFCRETDGVRVGVGLQTCDFCLHPGEAYDYVSASLFCYTEGYLRGHNDFRRYMRAISPIGKGERPDRLPLCFGTWGGLHERTHLQLIDYLRRENFGFDVYWMDAGWFGRLRERDAAEESAWYTHVGNWDVNPAAHPSGFAAIRQACKDAGLQTLLWVEPERAMRDSDLYVAHPDWFLARYDGDPSSDQYLLDLGNSAARAHIFGVLCGLIERLDLAWLRPDYNVNALPYMRGGDEDGRRGIAELGYFNGLYALIDSLLEKYPRLMIDNCAGGGNRMDIEMQRRCVTLWRSDYDCYEFYDCAGLQAATLGAGLLFPYYAHGCRVASRDLYDIRAGYAAGADINTLNDNYCRAAGLDKVNYAKSLRALLHKVCREYEEVRHLYAEDFCPHAAYSADPYTWCAYEFYKRDRSEGVLQVFRRDLSAFARARYPLACADEAGEYEVRDLDTGRSRTYSGAELATSGLPVYISAPHKAKIYHIIRKNS